MFNHALIYLFLAVPCANAILKESKEYFVYGDVEINETSDCQPLNNQEFYWQTSDADNITQIIKLNCLFKEHSQEKYFPKCCPPNYAYHRKHHKCVENNRTGIHEVFSDENLLIRTDLFNCTVVLDYILSKNVAPFAIHSDRSLHFNGKSYKLGNYCLDNHLDDEEFVIRICEDVSACKKDGIRCISKCCPDGQYYKGVVCRSGSHFGLSLENNTRFIDRSEHFNAVVKSEKCRRYVATEKYEFHIRKDGAIVIREVGVWKQYNLEENYYCMEYIDMKNLQGHQLLLCMIPTPITPKFGIRGIFMIASCLCLLFTLFGYLILPDLKNLIGNIIITYCSCLFVAFVFLTVIQFSPNVGKLCHIIGFGTAFAFMSAFAWMTILSYEIWRVLGSMVTEYGHRLPGEARRYLQYSLFGWLVPITLIGLSLIDHLYYIYPAPIHINLGENKCVFENHRIRGEYGYVFQFAVPCGVLLFVNIITFVKTIIYIFQVKSEIQKMNVLDSNDKQKKWKAFTADKEKIAMVLKIFLVMGLNWLFELLSSAFFDFSTYDSLSTIEIIFDGFNALQGVFIFCIFMVKKKIFKSMLKILNIKIKNRRSSVATCSTEVVMIPTSVRGSRYEERSFKGNNDNK